jgi:serine protease Do
MKLKTLLNNLWIALATISLTILLPSASADTSTPFDFNVFAKLAKQAVPSVVNLMAESLVPTDFNGSMQNPFPPEFFGGFSLPPGMRRSPQPPRKEVALGSGFIIDADGLLLTNNHVVANAEKVEIQLTESEEDKPIEGKVVGRDPELDVAIIRFTPPRKLTALALGNSDSLEVGEFVMAVGNPYGQGHSVSHGIVSAKGRVDPSVPVTSYLQTDAPINPGNSGGPLLNLKGEVVGINNAIDARAQGISFAIPINYVKNVLPQLETKGKVSRGFIGAVIGQVDTNNLHAPIVSEVAPNGPADRAGIKPNDIITTAGTTTVHSPSELILAVTSTPVGTKIPFTIIRGLKTMTLQVKVEQRPDPRQRVSQR